MDHNVLQNNRVHYPSAFAHFDLCTNRDIRSNLRIRVDVGRWVDADKAFDLTRINVVWFRQNCLLHILVVLHVEFLGSKEFMRVIDPQPEVLALVQVVEVCFLLVAKRKENVFEAVLLLV